MPSCQDPALCGTINLLILSLLEQLVDPYTYVYDTAVFSVNGEYPVYHDGVYQTDVIHSKALGALQEQRNQTKPFFLWGT